MTRALPPLTWFRSFEAAARTLSFTAAAEEIGLTQSAVSQQIKALEQRLRTPLFDRRPRGLALTDAGRRLLPEVEQALGVLSRATARHMAPPQEAALTVAASVSIIEWVIAPHLPDFLARHPGARVGFQGTIWPDEYAARRADVEIRFGSARQVGAGARALPAALVAVRAPHCEPDAPRIGALGTSVGWDDWARAAGWPVTDPALWVDSYGMALALAIEGAGLALVNRVVAARALARGQVVACAGTEVAGQEGYHLYHDASRPLACAFADWLWALTSDATTEGAPA